ncbi:MAG: SWIM zinc finger domain-containing protein [Nitrospirae bacterium]|nr:MAG: SWIM zinc finger domain-containing protein [Nitrospirota bacterium]
MKKHSDKTFSDITWSDLEAWAGSKIVSRGMSYKKERAVQGLSLTPEGSLLAWVRGTRNYVTRVSFEKGRLLSVCSCPYHLACKHAVAVVLEYLDHLQADTDVPLAEEDDERIVLLEDETLAFDDDEDDMDDDEYIETDEPDIDSSLEKKSKKELRKMLKGIIKDYPEIKKEMGFAPASPKKKGCPALIKSVTKAMVVTSSEQGWRNYWKHTGHTPDYSPVRVGLQRLLDEGCADDVVRLGEKLFVKGTEQVGQSHDEGETADEIAATMPIIFKALAECSLSDTDKLERAVDFGLRDEYGLCRGLDEFLRIRFAKKSWSELADRLLSRLKDMRPKGKGDSFFRHYERNNLSDEAIRALENAGREEEALAVCFHEAEATGSFERLVKRLRKAGRTAEAEEWIRKGVKATQDKLPGIAASLKKELLDIRRRKKDWLFAAALLADEFFESPSLKDFEELRKACEKSKVWPGVRAACLKFLETGEHPGGRPDWPLPETGFAISRPARWRKPPFTDVLIDIAIEEKNIDAVVHWYNIHKKEKDKWPEAHLDDAVADAIAQAYPDKAITIWKNLAEGLMAQTNVSSYSEAVKYLKKVRKKLEDISKASEWAVYLKDLTETNKRKTRLVQMLNALSGKPIISK